MICKICGAEKDTRRQMHGHLMRMHQDEYRQSGFVIERMVTGAAAPAQKRDYKKAALPSGFRALSSSDPEEAYAIDQGYDFIDAEEMIYTAEEAKVEGWI